MRAGIIGRGVPLTMIRIKNRRQTGVLSQRNAAEHRDVSAKLRRINPVMPVLDYRDHDRRFTQLPSDDNAKKEQSDFKAPDYFH